MIWPILILGFLGAVNANGWSTWSEERDVFEGGLEFTCKYGLRYKFVKDKLVIHKKSKIECLPDLKKPALKHTEIFYFEGMMITVQHWIKKKADTVISIDVEEIPTTTMMPTTTTTTEEENGGGPIGGEMHCSCKVPLMPDDEVYAGRSLASVLTRKSNALNRYGNGEMISGHDGMIMLMGVFFLSMIGGFLGAAILGLLNGSAMRSLNKLERMDLEHALLLRNLEDSERELEINGDVNQAIIQSIISNPDVLQAIIDQAMESGVIGEAMEQAMENGAMNEALMNLVESGAIEEGLKEMFNNTMTEVNIEELISQLMNEENAAAMEEAFMEWFQEFVDTIDPQMLEEMMNSIESPTLEMECDCTPY